MRDFGSPKTLNGIEVYDRTLHRDIKHLRNPVDIPTGKGRKGAKVRTWVDRQASHGYDALYRDAKSCEHGNWIIWHPYVLFPVHRVEVADSNRQNILECLPEKTQVGEPILKVNFKKPTGVGNVEESKPDAVTQARSIMLEKDLEKLRQVAGSVSPLYENVNVWHPWDGKSLSTGAVDAIPQRIEKSLASKLSFVSTKVANTAISQPKTPFACPYEVTAALLKQLALQKTQANFGNAGAVEQLLKHALGNAMNRPMVTGKTLLTLEDVGVKANPDNEQKDPLNALNSLYRMDEIKKQLTQLRNEMIVAEREGSALPQVGHFVFRGSPGTGKTSVARVMATILHGMKVLATPKLVETSGLDLTAQYVGQTKQKVTEKLGKAKGGLLFIDEAYELGKATFGEEAMTTLVAAMTDPSYVGMVIIIAGYPKDMDQMLDRNVGLKSRFRRFIDFPDWEAQDALVFLSEKAEAENFEVESEAVMSLQKTIMELKKLSNFGNGRDAMRVWKELLQHRAQRVVNKPEEERTIAESDAEKAGEAILVARRGCGIPGKNVASDENLMKLLDGLYRMDTIRDQLACLQTQMAVTGRENSTRPEIGHFVFGGSPGTGKTTVARVMAQILHAMSALGTTKLVKTSGLILPGTYELGKGHFGEEAMTTLVAAMTDPSYTGMVIVIAGYPKDMDIMLNRNAGLKSRFKRFIDFPDWEANDGVAFLKAKAQTEGITLENGTEFLELKRLDGFGNGRDTVRVSEELLQCRAQRVFDLPEEVRTITANDAQMAGEGILAARRPPDGQVLS
ncbi:unnamed protein product [Peronospora destructor]|uniref:AAA+ ATPase domain-containing protein n=1 Tax=Peronospora destructor TaxID=86335 RepID=A0AAV0UT76_9STRA|nr:unnamed protein product [Peronospora destructor]